MEDNKKVVEVEETFDEVVEEETKLDKIKNSKPVTFMKRHGKKIAIAAGIGAAFLIGRALGAKEDEYSEYDDSDNDDVIELEDYQVEETTEENE